MDTIVCISGTSRPGNYTIHALRGVASTLAAFIEEFVHPRQVLEEMVRQDGPPWSATV